MLEYNNFHSIKFISTSNSTQYPASHTSTLNHPLTTQANRICHQRTRNASTISSIVAQIKRNN